MAKKKLTTTEISPSLKSGKGSEKHKYLCVTLFQGCVTTEELKSSKTKRRPTNIVLFQWTSQAKTKYCERNRTERRGKFHYDKKKNKVERNLHTLRDLKVFLPQRDEKNDRSVNRKVSKKEMKHCDEEKTLGLL